MDDLRQPENTGPEIVSQENQQRDEDQGAQEIVQEEFAEPDPHGPGGKKSGDPESGDEPGNEYGLVPMVPVELPDPFQAALGYNPAQIAVVEEVLAPFFSDGVNGLLFAPRDSDNLKEKMQYITDNPGVLDKFRANIPEVKDIEDNARELEGIYISLTGK